jgi:hypothetical protein
MDIEDDSKNPWYLDTATVEILNYSGIGNIVPTIDGKVNIDLDMMTRPVYRIAQSIVDYQKRINEQL